MIIFDLDGTLALDAHRAHHLSGDNKEWDLYFSKCLDDEPNSPLLLLFQQLIIYGDEPVGVWSGRSDSVRPQTLEWFHRHTHLMPGAHFELRLRASADRTDDHEMKKKWLQQLRAAGGEVSLVFEDRKRVVEMWRSERVVCCQVAPGEF